MYVYNNIMRFKKKGRFNKRRFRKPIRYGYRRMSPMKRTFGKRYKDYFSVTYRQGPEVHYYE